MVSPESRVNSFSHCPEGSRVWIFQSTEPLSEVEISKAREFLEKFLAGWKAHQMPLLSYGEVFMSHFLVIVVDETLTSVSGCAGDALHRAVRELGGILQKDLFDRLHYPVIHDGRLSFHSRNELRSAVEHNLLTGDDLLIDHTVGDLKSWRNSWMVPLMDSWLANPLGLSAERE